MIKFKHVVTCACLLLWKQCSSNQASRNKAHLKQSTSSWFFTLINPLINALKKINPSNVYIDNRLFPLHSHPSEKESYLISSCYPFKQQFCHQTAAELFNFWESKLAFFEAVISYIYKSRTLNFKYWQVHVKGLYNQLGVRIDLSKAFSMANEFFP